MPDAPLSPAEQAQQNRASMLRIVRMIFGVLLLVVTLSYILNLDSGKALPGGTEQVFVEQWWVPLTGACLLGLVALALDILTPVKKLSTVGGVFFGLLFGLIASFVVSLVIDLLGKSYEIASPQYFPAIKILFGIVLCYLGISAVLQTQDDLRLVIPYVEFARQTRGPRPLILDTSALIDARIADLAPTGIISAPLIIPEFVLLELQRLADSQDKLKRARGRRGLEVATRLQRASPLAVSIDRSDTLAPPATTVDQRLIELARTLSAAIATTDSGLARVAALQQINIVNIHEVASALKPSLVPGSQLSLHLMRPGEQPHQAVGFLEDGTMVVVDHAAHAIGTDQQLEVSSSLQTAAGRLIFARLLEPATPAEPGVPALTPPPLDGPPPLPATFSPVPAAPKPGPFGPGHGPKNPLRNPRR
ncbi:MAG: PIN/TRAM domain-containing protein [Phycisphaerales bacterium]